MFQAEAQAVSTKVLRQTVSWLVRGTARSCLNKVKNSRTLKRIKRNIHRNGFQFNFYALEKNFEKLSSSLKHFKLTQNTQHVGK